MKLFHWKCIKQLSCKPALAKITLVEILQEASFFAQPAQRHKVSVRVQQDTLFF